MIPKQTDYFQLTGTVNHYKIYKKFSLDRGSTRNFFYHVYRADNPRRELDLLLLKAYVDKEGYQIQKNVLQNSGLYSKVFIDSCDAFISQGQEISYIIQHFMEQGSLIELLNLIKSMPLTPAKYFIREILNQIKIVHQNLNIRHHILYSSDILIDKQIKPVVMGWSKAKKASTEKQIIFDCAQILCNILLGRPLPSSPIKKDKKQSPSRNFVQKKHWDLIVKTIEKKIGKNQILLNLLQICLTEDKGCTFEGILHHPFFEEQIDEVEVLKILDSLQKKKSSEKKKESIEKLGRKVSRLRDLEEFQASLPSEDRIVDKQFVKNYISYQESFAKIIDEQGEEEFNLSCRKEKSEQSSESSHINKLVFLLAHLNSFFDEQKNTPLIFQDGEGILKQAVAEFSDKSNSQQAIIEISFQFYLSESESLEKAVVQLKMIKNRMISMEISESELHHFYQRVLVNLLREEIELVLS